MKYYNFCTKLNICRKYQGKKALFKPNYAVFKNISNFNLSRCLTLFPPSVSWDIMGYESYSLPYYMCPMSRPHTIILKLNYSPGYSTSRTMSWYHHLMNMMYPRIFSAPLHSSYMGRSEMYAAMVVCIIWMYYLMGHIPATYRASYTGGHYHLPSLTRRSSFTCDLSIHFCLEPVWGWYSFSGKLWLLMRSLYLQLKLLSVWGSLSWRFLIYGVITAGVLLSKVSYNDISTHNLWC